MGSTLNVMSKYNNTTIFIWRVKKEGASRYSLNFLLLMRNGINHGLFLYLFYIPLPEKQTHDYFR